MNVKLSGTQLKKLKAAAKNKTGTALRISLKMFNGNDLPHELLLTTRQKTKLRYAFNNNMSTDLKLSKAQIIKHFVSLKKSTSSPAHLFAIRGRRKRGPGTLQTRDQNLPKQRAYF